MAVVGDESIWSALLPKFPNTLQYQNRKQDVPVHVYERIRYEYQLARTSTLPQTINQAGANFMCIVRNEKLIIPDEILNTACAHCDAFLIPGLTSAIRLRSRSKRSRCNHHVKPKVKNEVVRAI